MGGCRSAYLCVYHARRVLYTENEQGIVDRREGREKAKGWRGSKKKGVAVTLAHGRSLIVFLSGVCLAAFFFSPSLCLSHAVSVPFFSKQDDAARCARLQWYFLVLRSSCNTADPETTDSSSGHFFHGVTEICPIPFRMETMAIWPSKQKRQGS